MFHDLYNKLIRPGVSSEIKVVRISFVCVTMPQKVDFPSCIIKDPEVIQMITSQWHAVENSLL